MILTRIGNRGCLGIVEVGCNSTLENLTSPWLNRRGSEGYRSVLIAISEFGELHVILVVSSLLTKKDERRAEGETAHDQHGADGDEEVYLLIWIE